MYGELEMAIKKTDSHQSLWESCDNLRGGMGGSQYKDYILPLLFIKYMSDKSTGDPYPSIIIPSNCSFNV